MSETEPVYGQTNIRKFVDRNPVTAGLVRRFMERCAVHVSGLAPTNTSVLDVGVAEGSMTAFLADRLDGRTIVACEYEQNGCDVFHANYPELSLTRTSVYGLPFPDASFDVVTAFEVLEHLDDPALALLEMRRVARAWVIVTVPYEPFFRLGNVARGKYVRRLGNTPGHINHWRAGTLRSLVGGLFPSVAVSRVFPWLLATASPLERSATGP